MSNATQERDEFDVNAPAIKFENIGDACTGVVVGFESQTDTDPNGEVKTFPNGDPKKVWIIAVEQTDGETGTIYARSFLQAAIKDAARKAGIDKAAKFVGAQIYIKYRENGKPSQKGFSPPKLYDVKVKPGKPPVATDDEDPFANE